MLSERVNCTEALSLKNILVVEATFLTYPRETLVEVMQIHPPLKHIFQQQKFFMHIINRNSPVFARFIHTFLTRKTSTGVIFVSIGKYMYIEASYWSLGDNAKLQLAVPRGTSYSCLIFYYHMYGSSMGTLNVFNGNDKIFTKSGNQGSYWKKVSRLLYLNDVVSMHIYTLP